MNEDDLSDYMDKMFADAITPESTPIDFVHLISAGQSDGAVYIAQEVDVAILSENGVTVERKKNVVIIPRDRLMSLAAFMVTHSLRDLGDGEEHEHEG